MACYKRYGWPSPTSSNTSSVAQKDVFKKALRSVDPRSRGGVDVNPTQGEIPKQVTSSFDVQVVRMNGWMVDVLEQGTTIPLVP